MTMDQRLALVEAQLKTMSETRAGDAAYVRKLEEDNKKLFAFIRGIAGKNECGLDGCSNPQCIAFRLLKELEQ